MVFIEVITQRIIPIIALIILIVTGVYLMIKAWKNRKETSIAVILLIFPLSLLMALGGSYLLLFILLFGVNT